MAIYSGNRTSLASVRESSTILEGYQTQCDALTMVAESVINDNTIFEAVIENDFYQTYVKLSEAEGEADEDTKEDAKKNSEGLFVRIWEGIKKICQAIKDKISSIILAFKTNMGNITKQKATEIKNKYPDFDIDKFNSKYPDFKIKYQKSTGKTEISKGLLDKYLDIIPGVYNCSSIEEVNNFINKNENFLFDHIATVTGNKIESVSDLSKAVHSYFYKEEEEDILDKKFIMTIDEILNSSNYYVPDSLKAAKSDIDTAADKYIREAKEKMDKAKKMDNKEERDLELAKANAVSKLSTGLQKTSGIIINVLINVTKFEIQQCLRLYVAMAKYDAKKKGSSDAKDDETKEEGQNESAFFESMVQDELEAI